MNKLIQNITLVLFIVGSLHLNAQCYTSTTVSAITPLNNDANGDGTNDSYVDGTTINICYSVTGWDATIDEDWFHSVEIELPASGFDCSSVSSTSAPATETSYAMDANVIYDAGDLGVGTAWNGVDDCIDAGFGAPCSSFGAFDDGAYDVLSNAYNFAVTDAVLQGAGFTDDCTGTGNAIPALQAVEQSWSFGGNNGTTNGSGTAVGACGTRFGWYVDWADNSQQETLMAVVVYLLDLHQQMEMVQIILD